MPEVVPDTLVVGYPNHLGVFDRAAIEAVGLTIDEHVYEDVEKFMAGTLTAGQIRKVILI